MRGFFYTHHRICLRAFLYLFDMSHNHLHAIRKHFKENFLVSGLINAYVLWTIANRPVPASTRLFSLKILKLKLIHDM